MRLRANRPRRHPTRGDAAGSVVDASSGESPTVTVLTASNGGAPFGLFRCVLPYLSLTRSKTAKPAPSLSCVLNSMGR